MRRLLAIALVALGAAALPGLASAGTIRDFQTPSKNIACAFVPADIAGGAAFLRCEIRSGLKPVPPRPRACDADWGQAVSFARSWIQGPPGQPFAYWYVIFFPALTIIMWGLGWNLLGDALRDALDPREK